MAVQKRQHTAWVPWGLAKETAQTLQCISCNQKQPLHPLSRWCLTCTIFLFSNLLSHFTISVSRKRAAADLPRFLCNFLVPDSTGMCHRCSIFPSGSTQLSLPGLDQLQPLRRQPVQVKQCKTSWLIDLKRLFKVVCEVWRDNAVLRNCSITRVGIGLFIEPMLSWSFSLIRERLIVDPLDWTPNMPKLRFTGSQFEVTLQDQISWYCNAFEVKQKQPTQLASLYSNGRMSVQIDLGIFGIRVSIREGYP